MKKKVTIALGILIILTIIGVVAVSAYRSSEPYRQKKASKEISDINNIEDKSVSICIDGVTYFGIGMPVPVEPDESSIEYVEIPVGGDAMITAFARLEEGKLIVCKINEEWYKFHSMEAIASSEFIPEEVIDTDETQAVANVELDEQTVDEQELFDELSNIVGTIGLENAYPWNNTAEFKENADIIIKLATDDSGRYEIYGIISQRYGDYGLLLNDCVNGEDNWNYEYLPWYYSGVPSDEPILESDGNGKFIFSYVYKYDDGVPMRKEATLDCGYDTGHMELVFNN